jgi:hypothetical protein
MHVTSSNLSLHQFLFEYMDDALIIQVEQQGKPNGESKQSQNAKELCANEQTHQSDQRMQSKLWPYDLWFYDISDNGDD